MRRAAPVIRASPDAGGRTVAEVLAEASRLMDLDHAERQWASGGLVQIRRPRKTLRKWLAGR